MGLDGYKLSSKVNFDYSRSLIKQLWKANLTVEEYASFVLEPKHLINPVRDVVLFDNPILEILTKSPWYAIILGWLPVIIMWL
jgi:4-hydroxysphinganine ceramide fatty acyl 2-hydroxylase